MSSAATDPAAGGRARKLAWRGRVSPTSTHYWNRKRREVARLLARHVPLAPGSQIADLGAGGGGDVRMLASVYPDCGVLALEFNGEALAKLRERFAEQPAVTVREADLREPLALADASLDLAHSSEVMEHMPDPAALLADVRRVLKPGGHLVFTTPNEPNVFQRAFWRERMKPSGATGASAAAPERAPAGKRQERDLFGHISLHTAKEWDEATVAAGFELVGFGRGAISYGGKPWLDREGALAAFFAAEALIDLAPRSLTRPLSNQHIGLYRRV